MFITFINIFVCKSCVKIVRTRTQCLHENGNAKYAIVDYTRLKEVAFYFVECIYALAL